MRRCGYAGAALVVLAWLLTAPAAALPAEAIGGCQPLSLREKAAQVVMTGIPTTWANEQTVALVQRHAGTVVLLGRNVRNAEQLQRLTGRLRQRARARMLVAIDEEGGRVSRLGEKGIVTRISSARRLAATRTPEQIRAVGARLGKQMAAVGMDWNFAPVLDVAGGDRNTVIGDRSYSGDPAVAAAAGRAFAEGLRSAGVLTTGKHFPGHGRTTVDSHESLPTVTASRDQLRRRDLRPFVRALPALDAVMTAHVRYTALDRHRPASLSRAATRLLRGDLGYRGLIITDALEMGAITSRWSVPEAAEIAVRNGADIVLIGDYARTPAATTRLVTAVREGRLTKTRIELSAAKVLRTKGYGQAEIDCLLAG